MPDHRAVDAPVLRSAADPGDAQFARNAEAHRALVADLNAQLATARLGGPPRARARHAERGKLLPRERVDALVDPSSPFLELSPLAAHGLYGGDAPAAGIITGIGRVAGRECVIVANDATVKGGTYYPLTVKKHLRAQEVALQNRLPCVYLVDSGGAYLPMQDEVFPDREHFGRIFYNQAQMSAQGIPQIAAVLGSCTAGGAYVPAMSDEAVIVRNQGTIFLGGPPLVQAATGEVVTAEELGGGDLHSRVSGVTDHLADDDAHALRIVRSIVGTLGPQRGVPRPWDVAPTVEPAVDPAELYGVVPTDPRIPYDVREVIARIVDGSRFHEFKPAVRVDAGHGVRADPWPPGGDRGQQRDPVLRVGAQGCALRRAVRPARRAAGVPAEHHRVHGRPRVRGGRDRQERRQDGDGRGDDPRAEADGRDRRVVRGRELLDVRAGVLAAAPVPVAERADLGDGRRAGGDGAVDRAQPGDPEPEEEFRERIRAQYETQGHPYYSTARLWDDGVIDPADTRTVLGLALSTAANAPLAAPAFGVFRM